MISFSRTWIRLGAAWDYQKEDNLLNAGLFLSRMLTLSVSEVKTGGAVNLITDIRIVNE
jgi:hypothetical protein